VLSLKTAQNISVFHEEKCAATLVKKTQALFACPRIPTNVLNPHAEKKIKFIDGYIDDKKHPQISLFVNPAKGANAYDVSSRSVKILKIRKGGSLK
jgi:hypothetical protein